MPASISSGAAAAYESRSQLDMALNDVPGTALTPCARSRTARSSSSSPR
jgi:hypothetical protein